MTAFWVTPDGKNGVVDPNWLKHQGVYVEAKVTPDRRWHAMLRFRSAVDSCKYFVSSAHVERLLSSERATRQEHEQLLARLVQDDAVRQALEQEREQLLARLAQDEAGRQELEREIEQLSARLAEIEGAQAQRQEPEAKRRRGGIAPRFDWDQIFAVTLWLLRERGWPEIKSYRKFASEICDACAEAGMEPVPDSDTVRERLSIWLNARLPD